MKARKSRLNALKTIMSEQQLGSQKEILARLSKMGFDVTQASLSRDLRQMKAAKIIDKNGEKRYVLPEETAYKRISQPNSPQEIPLTSGFQSIHFSENIGVIKTKPGYAGSIAYNIDNGGVPEILGTIAGTDTVLVVLKAGTRPVVVTEALRRIIADMQ